MNKSEIRKKILKIRKENKNKNKNINFKSLLKILKREGFKGKIIGGYYPYNYELDPTKILYNLEKKNFLIALPKIKKNFQMDFFEWSTRSPLSVNRYGIPEPVSNKIIFPDILLVPLVAFDKDLNRVGYGGGFYDRYIKKIQNYKNIVKIGLAYSFQKVKLIPTNKSDIKLDYIITEKN